MKRYIVYSLLVLTVSLLFASCNQDTDIVIIIASLRKKTNRKKVLLTNG